MAKRKNIENLSRAVKAGGKKYVRYDEGAELFSVGHNTFRQLAKEAGAIVRLKRIALVNVQKVEEYLEFLIEEGDF